MSTRGSRIRLPPVLLTTPWSPQLTGLRQNSDAGEFRNAKRRFVLPRIEPTLQSNRKSSRALLSPMGLTMPSGFTADAEHGSCPSTRSAVFPMNRRDRRCLGWPDGEPEGWRSRSQPGSQPRRSSNDPAGIARRSSSRLLPAARTQPVRFRLELLISGGQLRMWWTLVRGGLRSNHTQQSRGEHGSES